MNAVRLRPDETSLFNALISYRDSSHLAGRTDDEYLVAFIGNEGDLTHAGLRGSRRVSMRTIGRFRDLGLLYVLSETDAALAFDLADDFRERWERLTTSPPFVSSPTQPAAEGSEPSVERGIFISCSEHQKTSLGRPFRDLLTRNQLRGFIVSDEPRPGSAWTPEEKVDAYLDRSDAAVVFATGDIDSGQDAYTRPNIADEIGRARSKGHLRSRVCVLKEKGVTLPSNINPAYEQLDTSNPDEGFRRALLQLREWGFEIRELPEPSGKRIPTASQSPAPRDLELSPDQQQKLLEKALSLVPDDRSTSGEASLAVIIASAASHPVIRPAELEAGAFAKSVIQRLLFGDPALFEPGEATVPGMSGGSLIVKQSRGWAALDAFGTIAIVRPTRRTASSQMGMHAVIEEHVRRDISDVLRFASSLISELDAGSRIAHVVPVVALIGAGYTGWRTEAEQAASPTSMSLNMGTNRRPVAYLTPPARALDEVRSQFADVAEDLMVLLRREAKR